MHSELPNTSSPDVAQLNEARRKRWHQAGEALLTVENLRSWINAAGLVLFAPRSQVVAPAPTFMEAISGAPNSEETIAHLGEARGLLARLIADGVALPLNLMGSGHGSPADMPDFIVSAAVFSYVFTLRADKAWKQPPATSGPLKVSNLALAAYEALSARGPLSAYDLTTELGKEVTEAACLRALNELWTHLRVIPLIQPAQGITLWELTSARFTKQIKAGANAGQPTALSALISLYLTQAMAASEDEVESYLSPLAARSRIREVIHALLSAGQLETVAIEGKTLLHVSGEPPLVTSAEAGAPPAETTADASAIAAAQPPDSASRIKKFVPRPAKVGTGYLAKGKPAAGRSAFARDRSRKPPSEFKPRAGARDDRERRLFRKSSGDSTQTFDKPWEERRARGAAGAGAPRPTRPSPAAHDSARSEFRGGPRPGRPVESRPRSSGGSGGLDRRPERPRGRPPGGPDRGPNRSPDRGPAHRPGRSSGAGAAGRPDRGSSPTESRRPDRPPTARADENRARAAGSFDTRPRREGRDRSSAPERPIFRRFDDPKRDRPGPPRRRDGDTVGPRPRTGGFEPRPPRKQAGSDTRAPRREGGFKRPAARAGGSRPFMQSKSAPAGGKPRSKYAKGPAKRKPFQKKTGGGNFKPGKPPRGDESA